MSYVHIGCHFAAGEGWLNFDASPTLRIERIPLIGKLMGKLAGNAGTFPREVRFGDIVRGLPLADGSADAIYASHILEHLSREDMIKALANCHRLLKPGGVLRLIVPDLQERARRYLEEVAQGSETANDSFLRGTYLGLEARPRGLGSIRHAVGNSAHLWMWDAPSMAGALRDANFVDIARVQFGDSKDSMFSRVEAPDRFVYDGIVEIAMEARKSF